MGVQLLGMAAAPEMIGRLMESDAAQPSPEGQGVAKRTKLAPGLQKDLLRQIVDIRRRHPRQENCMHHPEEPSVQFAKGAIVAGARSADYVPQFAGLVRYDVLLLFERSLSEVGLGLKPDLITTAQRSVRRPRQPLNGPELALIRGLAQHRRSNVTVAFKP